MKQTLFRFCALLLALCIALSLTVAAGAQGDRTSMPPEELNAIHATDLMKTVNPHASQEAKNLLAYLYTMSDTDKFIVGQFDMYTESAEWNNIKAQYGVEPGLYSARYILETATDAEFPMGDFNNVDQVNTQMKLHYDQGAVLLVHGDGIEDYMDAFGIIPGGTPGSSLLDDMVMNLDKTNPDRDMKVWRAWEDYWVKYLAALKDLENRGVKAYLVRPFVEYNNRTFFFGNSTRDAYTRKVYQQTVQKFIDSDLNGWLMTYTPSGAPQITHSGYPGNEWLDVLAVTMYSINGLDGHYRSDFYGDYDWFCRTGKPMGLSELSCRNAGGANAPRSSWLNSLKDVRTRWPRTTWCACWSGGYFSLQNFDANGKLSNGQDDGKLFLCSPFSVNLSNIADYQNTKFDFSGVAQLYKQKNYGGAFVGLEERTYTAADLAKLGITAENLKSFHLNQNFGLIFYEGDNATGEYWAYPVSLKDTTGYLNGKTFRSMKVVRQHNLAYNVSEIYASYNDSSAYRANDAAASRWTGLADENGEGWLEVDLGQPYAIRRWIVKNASYAGETENLNTCDYQFQYSTDDENWITVDKVEDNTKGITDRAVYPFVAQYVRVYVTKANSYDGPLSNEISISELEVYGLEPGNAFANTLPQATGLYKVDGEWLYIENGQWRSDYNGFAKHAASNTWFYVTDGKIDWNLEGAFKHPSGIWFIVKNGQIDWGYNGFYKVQGVWFYFENGQINWNLTGLFKHPSGQWFYVQNAQINWNYTGFGKHLASNTWFYCENGTIAWSKSGAFKHPSGIWFMVNGGQIDWGYNGFYKVSGIWFYFENGQINWNLTGLYKLPSANAWFYVKNAQIDWSYNGKATKNGVTFNVRNGQVIF